MSIVAWSIYAVLAYLLWEKVLKIYYYYWYYKRQGIHMTGMPVPLLGNLIGFAKSMKNSTSDEFTSPPLQRYIKETRINGDMPGVAAFFPGATPLLYISDPDVV